MEQVSLLDDASAIELGVPQEFYRMEMVRGLMFGRLRERIVA